MSEFLPDFITPADLARHTGWSERNLRSLARKIGACRIIGNRMVLTKADVDAILEAAKPEPRVRAVDRAEEAYREAKELLAGRIGRGRKSGKRKPRG